MNKINRLGTYGTFAQEKLMARPSKLLKTLRNTFGYYGSLKGKDLRVSQRAQKSLRSLGRAASTERINL